MQSSLVSELAVVIPTHNRARTVARTIESVLAANSPATQVVVVDDASSDDTQLVLASFAGRGVILLRSNEHMGANYARNLGAAVSDAPILAFLDSDDLFEPSRPERLIEYFREHPKVDAVLDSFVVIRNGRRSDAWQPEIEVRGEALANLLITHAIPLTNSAFSVRRSVFEAIGGFDPWLQRQQDRDLLLRLSTTCNVALTKAKDVVKFQQRDSISRQGTDSVASLEALVARHSDFLRPQYRALLAYLTVRGIVKAVIGGRFIVAWQEFRSLRSCRHLPQSLWASLLQFRRGKRLRNTTQRAAYRQSRRTGR